MKRTYSGSCHCGAVTFEADLDLTQPTYRCNCTICSRTRFWPAIADPSDVRLLTGVEELTQYLFNTRKNEHYFCRTCGVRPFGIGTTPDGRRFHGINLGCLDADPSELAAAPRSSISTAATTASRPRTSRAISEAKARPAPARAP